CTYADFDELRGYCEKVAGAVGLACVPVYGSDDTEHAMTLGIALQLINIIRDVEEDRRLGRVYLPQDELAAFAVEELAPSPEFRELMAFEAERARTYLAEGLRLLESLDRRSALCVGTFAGLYRETLDRIEARGRPRAAPRQRAAHRARLFHRVPPLPRPDRRRGLVPPHAARAAGARRGRHGRGDRAAPSRTARIPTLELPGSGPASRNHPATALSAVGTE